MSTRQAARAGARALTLAGIAAFAALLAPSRGAAVQLDLGAVTCGSYENEVLTGSMAGYTPDPIDTVMWLFGFSIARSGERFMYGDSLKAFGFALDAECKNNAGEKLKDAVAAVKSTRQNPMDLTHLDCATFGPRHVALRKSDPENAATLTLWMFGYSVGLSQEHAFDPDGVGKFDARLLDHCNTHPQDSLFDALRALKPGASPAPAPPKRQRAAKQPPPATPDQAPPH